MNIKIIEILEKIIADHGNCDGVSPADCGVCPIGKMKIHEDGSPVSCVESVDIKGLSLHEANQKYLKAATSILGDITMDNILGEDDVVE